MNQEFIQYDHFKESILLSSKDAALKICLTEEDDIHIPHEPPFENEGAPDDDDD